MKSYRTISCPHFPRCGGCSTLLTPYQTQLEDKQRLLTKLFSFAKISVPEVLPSPQHHHYRHKVQLPFGFKRQGRGGTILLGCYGNGTHDVIDQHVCLVQDQELSRVAWTIREWARKAAISVYDERTRTGFLRHVLLRKGAGTGEVLVGLVTNGGRPPGSRNLAGSLLEAINAALGEGGSRIVGIVQNVNVRSTNVVLGEQEFVWWGRPFLYEKLGELRFSVGLSTFFQVNPYQTLHLYNEVLRWIEKGPRVLDVYCGVGSIALWIAKKSALVMGIEENKASVAVASKAARVNNIRNCRFTDGAAEALLPDAVTRGFDLAIFDPPRKGLDPSMIQTLLKTPLKRIIYVSCNPETLARDIQALLPSWKLISLQGVDMFPHTDHVEAVAVLDSVV